MKDRTENNCFHLKSPILQRRKKEPFLIVIRAFLMDNISLGMSKSPTSSS